MCTIKMGLLRRRYGIYKKQQEPSLLFALHKWLHMLSIHLCPYAMCTVNEIMISTPTKDGDKSPQELFSGVNISPKIKHFHTFACPTYILDNATTAKYYKVNFTGKVNNCLKQSLTRATLPTKETKTSPIRCLLAAIPKPFKSSPSYIKPEDVTCLAPISC